MASPAEPDQDARARTTRSVQRRQVVTLAVAGLLLLAFALYMSGLHNAFPPGWWRP